MAARAKKPKHMTVEEFLDWGGGGHVGKLELVDGIVRALSPASATHSVLQGNLVTLIQNHLRKKRLPCHVAPEAPVVPRLRSRNNARAPDFAVSCAPPSQSKVFEDPILLIEVLSLGNAEETWESVRAYGTIPTVREIAVVESESVGAALFRKDAEGAWSVDGEDIAAGGTLKLHSIGLEIPLAELYRDTYLA